MSRPGRIIAAKAALLDFELVISHYNENLNWLRPYADHAHIYHKGKDSRPPFQSHAWERLQNIGRESHTYLHHIFTHYGQVANVTIFLQGDAQRHGACLAKKPLKFISLAVNGVPCQKASSPWRNMGRIPFRENVQSMPKFADLVRANSTFGEFFVSLMGHEPPSRGVPFCYNACVAATKERIRRYTLQFYKKAISSVNSNSNPEEAHYIERLWYVLWKN